MPCKKNDAGRKSFLPGPRRNDIRNVLKVLMYRNYRCAACGNIYHEVFGVNGYTAG
jgi:hypothetical protein